MSSPVQSILLTTYIIYIYMYIYVYIMYIYIYIYILNKRNIPVEHEQNFSFICDINYGFYIILQNLLEHLFTNWTYGFTLRLFYCCLLCYYITHLFITPGKQQWKEDRFFLFEQHYLPLFVSFDRQTVLCSMFVSLFCNCFAPSVPSIFV